MNRRLFLGWAGTLLGALGVTRAAAQPAINDEDAPGRIPVELSDNVLKWEHSLQPYFKGRDGNLYCEAVGRMRFRRALEWDSVHLAQSLLDDGYRDTLEAAGWAKTGGATVTRMTANEVRVTRLYQKAVA